MPSQTPEPTTSSRIRAPKACARCNQKRVKCDASTVGQPCSRCRRSGLEECVLISSRRGQYARRRPIVSSQASDGGEAAASSVNDAERGARRDTGSISNGASGFLSTNGSNGVAPPHRTSQVEAIIEQTTPAEPTPGSQRSGVSSGTAHKEVSWVSMFNHFLDTRQTNSQDAIDKCSITYLGESFPLALVLEDLREGGRTRLHHPGPPIESPETVQYVDGILNHPPHLLPEDVAFLEAKHVFEYPPPNVYDAMIEVFLNTFLPIYTLVHRPEFEDHYRQKKLPWIIVHSCCFIATTFCTDVLIHRAGYATRKDARYAYYSKAKVLFDTNYERNKIVVLQSMLMLTFWGGGPNDYWNTWSWISAAVTIAETLGIHRSTLGANMSTKDRSLLKRLWWMLVVRDASCSTLVGRPFRINMEHGDAEMLTLQDFEVDAHILEAADHPLKISFADYQIQVARLSLLLYDIDYARFIPGPKALSMSQVYDRLQAWKNDLPMAVDWDQSSDLLATCLSMMYDHHLMLASLGVSGSEVAAGSHTNGVQLPFAELAAQRVSTQASAIIMKNQSFMVPHETYQPVFVAGVVSYMSMRSSQTTQARLGRSVVDNCRMVLHSVRDAWDAAPWIITLFDGLTTSVNASRAQERGEAHTMDMGRTPADLSAFMGDLDESTMGFGMPASWQSNPMFSALFDVSQPMDGFEPGMT
ncbi:hypothetical protein LTR95_016560 [Oleoguttula sp. CCFEE 5521]